MRDLARGVRDGLVRRIGAGGCVLEEVLRGWIRSEVGGYAVHDVLTELVACGAVVVDVDASRVLDGVYYRLDRQELDLWYVAEFLRMEPA